MRCARRAASADADFAYDYLRAKAKDKTHQPDLREIELNEIRARLIPAEAARVVVGEAFAVVRERLLAVRRRAERGHARLLAQTMADAVVPLSEKTAEAIGAPDIALRH